MTTNTYWVAMRITQLEIQGHEHIPSQMGQDSCGVLLVYPTRELAEQHNPDIPVAQIRTIANNTDDI